MKKLLIAASFVVAASTGAALAQGQGPGAMLAAADANHDGNITRAEFDAARGARFTQMDSNHDGSLQATERPQWGGAQPANGSPPAGAGQGMRGDANGDGVVSRAEYDAQAARMFDRMDADHNGSISQAEIAAMQQARAARQ